ncbi:MAG: tryptophan-rich sensory protein [Methanomicrobiales archaeon]|nr:tryptophan-rich sensory protein [Methanomicrobiales archaeon]
MRAARSFLQLILCILICQGAGIFGSIFTITKIPTWYAGLNRPDIAPPNWVFGPVWTTLYLLMGISLYIVLQERERKETGYAIGIFAVQLILNASWSYFFFGLESTLLGFISILFVLAAVILTVISFFKVSRRASLLLIPYLAWVSFATLVAYQLWMLNP